MYHELLSGPTSGAVAESRLLFQDISSVSSLSCDVLLALGWSLTSDLSVVYQISASFRGSDATAFAFFASIIVTGPGEVVYAANVPGGVDVIQESQGV